jgi:DNA-directed RNA polymerase subunit E'/Rpb7
MQTIVTLHPAELTVPLHTLLLQKVRDRADRGECTQEHGYILDVRHLQKVLENKVSYDGSVLVTCLFDITYFKPEVGMELEETVVDIFDQGIFCNLKGRIRTLIPRATLVGYTYTKQCYTSPDGRNIQPASRITICITQTRYTNGNYSCIAALCK